MQLEFLVGMIEELVLEFLPIVMPEKKNVFLWKTHILHMKKRVLVDIVLNVKIRTERGWFGVKLLQAWDENIWT